MTKIRVSSYLGALFALAVAQAAASPMVLAYEQERSEYGAGLRLASLPARVRLSAPVLGAFVSNGGQDALDRAMKTWSSVEGAPLGFERAADGETATIEVKAISEGWKWGATIGAHTEIAKDALTGEIRRAVIELDVSQTWSDAAKVPKDAIDLETVLLHELGHAAGLAHSWDNSAVMRAGIKKGQSPRRTLTKDDIDGIVSIYKAPRPPVLDKPIPLSRAPYRWVLLAAAGLCLVGGFFWQRKKRRTSGA